MALYSLGRFVRPHQTPGGKGGIFELKFYYDNDYGNGEQGRVEKTSGRIMDYEIRENWGRIDTGIYSKA